MKAKDILATKGKEIVSINEETSVFDVVTTLTTHKIGFLIVTNTKAGVAGVISERDVVHKCVSLQKDPAHMKAKEIMTPRGKLVSATEEEDVQSIMNVMTEKKIRHLPVFSGDQLTGIISIGDVIKFILEAKDSEIKTLTDYAFGQYPG